MLNCHHLLMGINNGGKMRKKVTTSMPVHGQMLVGKLRALISTGNEQDWFVLNKMRTMHKDYKHQRAAGATVRYWGGVAPAFWADTVAVRRRCDHTPEGRGRLRESCDVME